MCIRQLCLQLLKGFPFSPGDAAKEAVQQEKCRLFAVVRSRIFLPGLWFGVLFTLIALPGLSVLLRLGILLSTILMIIGVNGFILNRFHGGFGFALSILIQGFIIRRCLG